MLPTWNAALSCPPVGSRLTCNLDLRLLHVQAVYLAGLDQFREPDRDRPRPASEVQDSHAGLEVWQKIGGVSLHAATVEKLAKLVRCIPSCRWEAGVSGLSSVIGSSLSLFVEPVCEGFTTTQGATGYYTPPSPELAPATRP